MLPASLACRAVEAEKLAAASGLPNPLLAAASAPLLKAQQAKTDHYQPLMNLVKLQSLRGERPKDPAFLGCLMSHDGEFSPHLFLAIEWLTRAFKRKTAAAGHRRDGLRPQFLAARFRSRLKDELIAACAKGFGLMLISAGGFNPSGKGGRLGELGVW